MHQWAYKQVISELPPRSPSASCGLLWQEQWHHLLRGKNQTSLWKELCYISSWKVWLATSKAVQGGKTRFNYNSDDQPTWLEAKFALFLHWPCTIWELDRARGKTKMFFSKSNQMNSFDTSSTVRPHVWPCWSQTTAGSPNYSELI